MSGYGNITGYLDDDAAEAAGETAILGIPRLSAQAGGTATGTGTGQYGFVPIAIQDAAGGLWGKMAELPTIPFAGSLSALDIFLIVGLILVASIVWNFVLYHIRLAAETI